MATELTRSAIRVISNYTRLFLLLIIGILLVPILLTGLGKDAFGLIGLLGSSMGIAEMCRSIMQQSLNRELGDAYHDEDPIAFPKAYNGALLLAAGLAVITAVLFATLWLVVPFLNIPPEFLDAARLYIVAQGVVSTITVLVGPAANMLMVSERLVLSNLRGTLYRATDLVAAIILFFIIGVDSPPDGLKAFALLSTGSTLLVLLVSLVYIVWLDQRLIPDPTHLRVSNARRILPTAWWNSTVVAAMNLHIRVDQLIMNLFFGVAGNAVFTLGLRLSSYVRMIAGGGTDGLDVVSARLSRTQSGVTVARLMGEATRMHAAITFPAGVVVLLLGDHLMNLWVGRQTADPSVIAEAVTIAQILVVGMTVRGIADCWSRILYGAGYIRRYAPVILLGGVFNPVVALALVYLAPGPIAFNGPAIAFTAVFCVVHGAILPLRAAKCLDVSIVEILSPLIRPFFATVISSSILLVPVWLNAQSSVILLLACLAGFGVVYALLSWYYVLYQVDRSRLHGGVLRQLQRLVPGSQSDSSRVNSSE